MTCCVIVEISAADSWPPFRGYERIPEVRRPTTLHPSREIADAEALRLANEHWGRRFMVFEAQAVATTIKVPAHITLGGTVICSREILALMAVDDDEVPF